MAMDTRYVHHLTEEMKEILRSSGVKLPLLAPMHHGQVSLCFGLVKLLEKLPKQHIPVSLHLVKLIALWTEVNPWSDEMNPKSSVVTLLVVWKL